MAETHLEDFVKVSKENAIIVGCDKELWNQWVLILQSDPAVIVEKVSSNDLPDEPDSIKGGMSGVVITVHGSPFEILGYSRKEREEAHIKYPFCLLIMYPAREGKSPNVYFELSLLLNIFVQRGGALYLPVRKGGKRSFRQCSIGEIGNCLK